MTPASHRKPNGRFVTASGAYRAFVPDPLPPPIEWTSEILAALSSADRSLGRLAGAGRGLPNPHLLLPSFIRREAVLSSRIEGTRTSLGELLASEAGAVVDRAPEDLREVANYVVALEYGVRRLPELPLSLRLLRELHEDLMRGVRGDHAAPGEFRRTQNWIGRPGSTLATATYVPPPADLMVDCLGALEKYLHDSSLPPLAHAALVHSQFEAIHPFLDGNGRVGRLLITLSLIEKRVLQTPLLYLSAYFEATREEYYARLLGVTQRGEWEEWLVYFFRGVTSQAEDALTRIERIVDLMQDWRDRIAGGTTALRAIELLIENPYWTVRAIGRRLNVAFTTAQRAIDRLESAGIVRLTREAQRNRVYVARDVLRILEAPVRLDLEGSPSAP